MGHRVVQQDGPGAIETDGQHPAIGQERGVEEGAGGGQALRRRAMRVPEGR